MFRVRHAAHISCILDQRVLKSAAGAEKRTPVFPGVADGIKRTNRVRIGARRYAPDAVEAAKPGVRARDGTAVDPQGLNLDAMLRTGQLQRLLNRLVSHDRRVNLSHPCDP